MRVRAILLDALGTIVALEPPGPRLAALLRERHAIEVDRDAVAARAARRDGLLPRALRARREAGAAGRAAPRVHRAPRRRARRRGAALGDAGAAADAARQPALRPLSRGARDARALACERASALVVASNRDVSLHDVLAATGLRELLDGVATSAEVGAAKPAPALFEAALRAAGVGAAAARPRRRQPARGRRGRARSWDRCRLAAPSAAPAERLRRRPGSR